MDWACDAYRLYLTPAGKWKPADRQAGLRQRAAAELEAMDGEDRAEVLDIYRRTGRLLGQIPTLVTRELIEAVT